MSVSDRLARACDQLQLSALPDSLPCREKERAEIERFLESSVRRGGLGSALYVSGMPGTGKTATVTEVLRRLQDKVDAGELPSFLPVEVNAMSLSHPFQLYSVLHTAVTGKRAAPARAATLLEAYFASSAARRPVVVAVVDELDYLVTKKQTVLYNLFEWPSRPLSRLVVVGLANTMDLPERLLPKVHSRLGLNRVVFPPYTRAQIQTIVSARLRGLDVFENDAIEMAARKVASLSGDVRRALQICRRAAELARERIGAAGYTSSCSSCSSSSSSTSSSSGVAGVGRGKVADGENDKDNDDDDNDDDDDDDDEGGRSGRRRTRVTIADVSAAAAEMSATHTLTAIAEGSAWERLFLTALVLQLRATHRDDAPLRDVVRRFLTLLRVHRNELATLEEGMEVARRLGDVHLCLLEEDRLERFPDVRLNVQLDDVVFALREDDVCAKLLAD